MKVRPQFFSLNVKQNAAWSYFRQFDRHPVFGLQNTRVSRPSEGLD